MAFTLACLLPTYLLVRGWQTMRHQEVSIDAINDDSRIQEITLDFNRVTLRVEDVDAYLAWLEDPGADDRQIDAPYDPSVPPPYLNPDGSTMNEEEASAKAQELKEEEDARTAKHVMDPSLRSLPFAVSFQEGKIPRDPGAYPERCINPANWIYYNLPFNAGVVVDPGYFHARFHGLRPATELADVQNAREGMESVNALYAPGLSQSSSDPWFTHGLYRMAPSKWWDWYTGRQLIAAKASYNFAAYVAAARVTALMRIIVAKGEAPMAELPDSADRMVPARVLAHVPEAQRVPFANRYSRAFKGKLPIVHVQVQPLDDESLKKYPPIERWLTRTHNGMWDITMRWWPLSEGAFMTGMRMGGSQRAGRPEYTDADFLFRSTPHLNPDSVEAQEALRAMLTMWYWKPLLLDEGAEDSMSAAEEILTMESARLARDLQFAKLHGHEAYRHDVDFE